MARPAKPAGTGTGIYRKEILDARKKAEAAMKGDPIVLKSPAYLSDSQKRLYRRIVRMLEKAGTLGKIDTFILEQTVIAIDRLQSLNVKQNENPELITDRDVLSAINAQTKIFFRGCNELGLSPQARAKLGIIAAQKEEEDPLGELMDG